uniref:Clp1 P-loop domain-containing protein n=1 Tax=Trypanosoma congolense (strain IL3000) TaxID=1068625 RepID=G0UR73_TRYCI|nr:conserved hypothetical protein [Trypanosoma congolense IL3000]
MRRRRQLVAVGTTDVVAVEAAQKEQDGAGPLLVNNSNNNNNDNNNTQFPANTITADVPEGGEKVKGVSTRDESSESDAEPPFKRFKIPEKVQARLTERDVLPQGDTTGDSSTAAEDADSVADVIGRRKLLASSRCAAVSCVQGGGVQAPKPLLFVRRLPRHGRERDQRKQRVTPCGASGGTADGSPEESASDDDEIIRFGEEGSSDSEGSFSDTPHPNGSGSGVGAERREIDRHFAGYASDEIPSVGSSSHEDEAEEGEEGEEAFSSDEEGEEKDGETDDEGSLHSDSGDVPVEGTNEASGCVSFGLWQQQRPEEERKQRREDKRGTGDAAERPKGKGPVPSERSNRFSGVDFEMHINHSAALPCHHVLVQMRSSLTVQGPCCIVGLGMGEVSVGGFFLGKKQITLLCDSQCVVMTPVRRLKTKNSELDSLPTPERVPLLQSPDGSFTVVPTFIPNQRVTLNQSDTAVAVPFPTGEGGEESLKMRYADDLEMFGTVDWDWVETAVVALRRRQVSGLSCVVLIVQPYGAGAGLPTRRHYLNGNVKGTGGNGKPVQAFGRHHSGRPFIEVPLFVARRPVPDVDASLLPNVIPTIVKQCTGSVIVLGSQGIGKSTLCRFLANAFFSQYGVCYWLELDIGQPEFGPPGVLSLYRVISPLLSSHDVMSAELVAGYYVGGARMRCPVAVATALAHICEVAGRLQGQHPIVVNTHGWVLSTGRRITVEAIRRLRPTHIIHLVTQQEEQWARSGESLMNPANGLNPSVLNKRFLVGGGTTTAPVREGGKGFTAQTPSHRSTFWGKKLRTASVDGQDPSRTCWTGAVHTVHVRRDHGPLRNNLQPKASAIRRDIWSQYLAPIFHHYGRGKAGGVEQGGLRNNSIAVDEEGSTALLTGLLDQFEALVFTDVTEARDLTVDFVCAALEHSVVALSIRVVPADNKSVKVAIPQPVAADGHACRPPYYANCRCLVDVPEGFTVTCFGVVESSEADMRTSGEIRVRLPLHRSVVHRMLSVPGEGERVALSLACAVTDRTDTAAVQTLF